MYNDVVPQSITNLSYREGVLFITAYNGVGRLDLSNGYMNFEEHKTDGKVLLAVSEQEVLLCSPQKAVYITFRT